MTIDEAVRNLDNLLIACDQSGREAWQTLKAAVLAQQTNNKQSDEITPSCIECANFYACVQKPAKTNGCFSKSA